VVWVAYFFAGGTAYFVGAILIALTTFVPRRNSARWRAVLISTIAFSGMGLALLSATPAPVWLYVVWFGTTTMWLVSRLKAIRTTRRVDLALRTAVMLLSAAAIAGEGRYARNPRPTGARYERVYVIGDSISAGIGLPGETGWPRLLAAKCGASVENLAVAGATVHSAFAQASHVVEPSAIVVLEIGGNDLLSNTRAEQFESDLKALVAAVRGPRRLVMVVELPLLPFCNRYGAAQRSVASTPDVVLIPKRHLARVLSTRGATIDGLHLSNSGQAAMAETIWSVLKDVLEPPRGNGATPR
jgi:acyl-CoA thioesterase I